MTRRRSSYVCVFLKFENYRYRRRSTRERVIFNRPIKFKKTLIRFDNTASYCAKNRPLRTLYRNCYRPLLSSIRLVHFNNDNRFPSPPSTTVTTDARNGYYRAPLRSLLFCFCFPLVGPQMEIISFCRTLTTVYVFFITTTLELKPNRQSTHKYVYLSV